MLHFLPAFIRGTLSILLLAIFTLLLAFTVLLCGLLRLIPIPPMRNAIDEFLHHIPEYWTTFLKGLMWLFTKTSWKVHGLKKLNPNGHYMMVANHRSWLDILVLQNVFSRKIPGLRFFMKKEFWKK